MKKLVLFLAAAFFFIQSSSAQVISARPNSGVRGQNLQTTITLAAGVMVNSSPALGYQDIYFQQGSTIIYAITSYSPYTSVNYYYDTFTQMLVWADSCTTTFPIPANAPLGYYDVVMITNPGVWPNVVPDTNRLANGMLIKEPAGTIQGKVYFDTNQNGVQDVGEYLMPNQKLVIAPTNEIAFTNSLGDYSFAMDTGTYTTSFQLAPGFNQTSAPLTYTHTIPPSVTGDDFGIYSAGYLYNHDVYIGGSRARCLTISDLYIRILNSGILPTQDVITLITSSNYTYSSATVPPNTINGDTLTWVTNLAQPSTSFTLGGTLLFTAPAANQTIDITVIDSVFDSGGIFIEVFIRTYSYQVRCSYDPNEKLVMPVGVLAQHYTPINSELTYTINFQNTGNDTAYDVFIYDTLDADLDLSTFEVIGSSHTLYTQMTQNGGLRFNFNNINLVDSGADEAASHGWVMYKISPLAGLPDPTEITNTSYIVFDQNYPIITNTTLNTLTALQYPESNFATADPTICETNCIIFSNQSTSGTSYEWIFQGGNPSTSTSASPGAVCYSTAGAYDVTLITTNALGSDTLTQASYISVANSPGVFAVTQAYDSLIAPQGFDSYQWYFNNVLISGATSYYYVAPSNGDYGVVVGNANGCQSGVNIPNFSIGIDNISGGKGFVIYPNPTSGQFEILFHSDDNQIITVNIFDAVGKIVESKFINAIAGDNKLLMDEQTLSKGVYTLELKGKSMIQSKLLMIDK